MNVEPADYRAESTQLLPAVTLSKTPMKVAVGPPIGLIDIVASQSCYLFRVSLPGLRSPKCNLKIDIQRDGKVRIEGLIVESRFLKTLPEACELKVHELCDPGPFSISFNLPGSVDSRLCAPSFRSDGILEVVVAKYKIPFVPETRKSEKLYHSVPTS